MRSHSLGCKAAVSGAGGCRRSSQCDAIWHRRRDIAHQGRDHHVALRCAFLLAGLLRRMVRDREGAALIVAILLVSVVEGLQERFLLVLVVLVHLSLWQIRNVLVWH